MSNYFDVWDIFRNEIVGDTTLFIVLALILVIYYGLKYKMPYQVLLLLSLLLLSIMFEETRNIGMWAFILLIVGGIFYYTLSKVMNR